MKDRELKSGKDRIHVRRYYQETQNEKEAYICSRIEDQIAYYEKKSAQNKTLYHLLAVLAVVANAMVPVLSVFIETETSGNLVIKVLITSFSSLAMVGTSLITLFNARELWSKYRSSASGLISLLHQYYTLTGVFAGLEGEEAFRLLAKLAEERMNEEHKLWDEMSRRDVKLKNSAG